MRFQFNQQQKRVESKTKSCRKHNKHAHIKHTNQANTGFFNVCDLVRSMISNILYRTHTHIRSHIYTYLAAFLVEMLNILSYKHHTVCISRWVVLLTFIFSLLLCSPLLLVFIRLLHYLIISAHFSFISFLFLLHLAPTFWFLFHKASIILCNKIVQH